MGSAQQFIGNMMGGAAAASTAAPPRERLDTYVDPYGDDKIAAKQQKAMDEQTGATVVEIIDEEPEEVEEPMPRTETIDFNGASEYRQQYQDDNREVIYHSQKDIDK